MEYVQIAFKFLSETGVLAALLAFLIMLILEKIKGTKYEKIFGLAQEAFWAVEKATKVEDKKAYFIDIFSGLYKERFGKDVDKGTLDMALHVSEGLVTKLNTAALIGKKK